MREQVETLGDARAVGLWTLVVVEPAEQASRRAAIGSAAESEIGRVLVERGHTGRERKGGAVLSVRCPFFDSHSPHKALDGSTVVMSATTERRRGWLHCSHAHCADRPQIDFLRALGIANEPHGVQRLRADLDENDGAQRVKLGDVGSVVRSLVGLAQPRRLVVGVVTLGAGKTREMIAEAVRREGASILAVPTHALGDEVETRVAERGEVASRRRGILRVLGDNGAPACKVHTTAAQWQASGGSVRELCATCAHARGCPARQREPGAKITIAPHQLATADGADDDDDATTDLDALGEEGETERPLIVVDESPALLTELSLTRADLDEAVGLLDSSVLDFGWSRRIAAFVHALRIAVDRDDLSLAEACDLVDRSHGAEPASLLAWAAQVLPTADGIRRGKIKLGYKPKLANDDLFAFTREREAWADVLRIRRVFRVVLAAAQAAKHGRIEWRPEGLAIHVLTREARMLLRGNVVLLDATADLDVLDALCDQHGVDLVSMRCNVDDGAKHERVILYSARASRSQLVPGKTVRWDLVRPQLARALDAVAHVDGRTLLVVYKQIANGLARGKLAELLAPFVDRLRVVHFGALRGLDEFKEYAACVTLGDPYPTLDGPREQAKLLGIDPDRHVRRLARAELAQAHGRMRDPSRSTSVLHVHVGAVAPLGWTHVNATNATKSAGRPKREAGDVTTEQLAAWVAVQHSKRAAAKVLNVPLTTLDRCLRGQALPRGVRLPTGDDPHSDYRITRRERGTTRHPHSDYRITCTLQASDPVIAVKRSYSEYRITYLHSAIVRIRNNSADGTQKTGASDLFDVPTSEAA